MSFFEWFITNIYSNIFTILTVAISVFFSWFISWIYYHLGNRTNLKATVRLYEDVLKKYPDYIKQFYNAAAVIINRSYKAPINAFEDVDDDLPF